MTFANRRLLLFIATRSTAQIDLSILLATMLLQLTDKGDSG
jgi:hypothetical protein